MVKGGKGGVDLLEDGVEAGPGAEPVDLLVGVEPAPLLHSTRRLGRHADMRPKASLHRRRVLHLNPRTHCFQSRRDPTPTQPHPA